jgi:hypothetical protein
MITQQQYDIAIIATNFPLTSVIRAHWGARRPVHALYLVFVFAPVGAGK